ncbi:SAFB-like transcription modulator [Helianthus annuus]|uniref:SAFB-like transcription modulator n=1 Tax=Helianthus annuus TaxID=4232 RepID=UPI00165333A3|nr:SAFB-like transcription modulator [Helianthus annuus]
MVTGNEENVNAQQSKNPEEAVDVNGRGDMNYTSTKSAKPTLESEVANAPSQSGSQQEESQTKFQIKKGIRNEAEENNNKLSVTTGDSGPKPAKRSRKNVGGGGSVAKKPKVSGEEVPESKKSKQSKESKKNDNKEAEAGDSKVKPAKRSRKKDKETDSAAKQPSGSGSL